MYLRHCSMQLIVLIHIVEHSPTRQVMFRIYIKRLKMVHETNRDSYA